MATIADKSTELGIDLEQIALDSVTLRKCEKDSIFHCFAANNETHNINIKDDNDVIIHNGYFRYANSVLAEGSSLATVEADFKSWLGGQEFIEIPAPDVYTDLV